MDTARASHDSIVAMSDTILDDSNTMQLSGDDLPVHERLANAVEAAIAAGQFRPGERPMRAVWWT